MAFSCNNSSSLSIEENHSTIPAMDNSQQPSPPNTYLPQIMHDGVIYYFDGNNPMNEEFELTEDAPRIQTTLSLSQIPTENGQANFGEVGAPYIRYDDSIAVLWNNKWNHFVTMQELLLQTESAWLQIHLGTPVEKVHELLGEPTVVSSGLWSDYYTIDEFTHLSFIYGQDKNGIGVVTSIMLNISVT